MPLDTAFVTSEHTKYRANLMSFSKLLICVVFITLLSSCGATRWHAIQEIPAESIAYLRDGVFISGDYIRNATIAEIDGKSVDRKNGNLIEIGLGVHKIKNFMR